MNIFVLLFIAILVGANLLAVGMLVRTMYCLFACGRRRRAGLLGVALVVGAVMGGSLWTFGYVVGSLLAGERPVFGVGEITWLWVGAGAGVVAATADAGACVITFLRGRSGEREGAAQRRVAADRT